MNPGRRPARTDLLAIPAVLSLAGGARPPHAQARVVTWIRSSACSMGTCVEVRHVDGHVEVRDNTAPDTVLHITPADWAAFLVGAKAGEFDGPAADGGPAPVGDWDRFLAAKRADMRIEVVVRAINQGALAGMPSEISDYAAWLVIDALDSFDADVVQRAYANGLAQGVALERARRGCSVTTPDES